MFTSGRLSGVQSTSHFDENPRILGRSWWNAGGMESVRRSTLYWIKAT